MEKTTMANDLDHNLMPIEPIRPQHSGTYSVEYGSEFAREIFNLIKEIKPHKIIETGTYLGQGTTRIIYDALSDNNLSDFTFITIEVDPVCYKKATQYFVTNNMKILCLNGLSIKKDSLPSFEEVQEKYVDNKEYLEIDYDYPEDIRAQIYFSETNYDVPDNLLFVAFNQFNFRPDIIMLDSAGHIGFQEFQQAIELAKGECYILLDDVFHCKHYKSLQHMMNNSDLFSIHVLSKERHGFCICKYIPIRN